MQHYIPHFESKLDMNTTYLFSVFVNYLNQVHEVVPMSDVRRACAIIGASFLAGAMCSAHLIVFMTFERFYSIIQPHRAASFNTVKKAKLIIVCVFLFGFSYNIPYLFITDNDNRYCIVNNDVAHSLEGQFYYWMHFTIGFAIPFVSLIIMNTVIIHTLQRRSQWVTSTSQGQGQNEGQSQSQSAKSSDRQIYITLLLVTFAFLILSTPFYAVHLWVNFANSSSPQFFATYQFLFITATALFFTNNGINFFLYVMSGKKFRTDLMKVLHSFKRKETPDGSTTSDSSDLKR